MFFAVLLVLLTPQAFAFPPIPGISTLGNVINDVAQETKIVVTPVGQVTVKVLSKACESIKKFTGMYYDDVKDTVSEPDVENLQITMKVFQNLTSHRISEAHRAIPRSKDFDVSKKTVLYIHGFTDDPTGASFETISNAFAAKNDYNLLALDGSSLIKWLYLRSTTYVRFMGEKLGLVLAELVNSGVPRENILLLGHSLGSHIAGFAGKTFKNKTGTKLPRISSMDPAGPCFIDLEQGLRLSKDDADFVDVIHSNAGLFGLKESIGHVDFYPNGGANQPGCVLPTCEHSRAWELYAESVLNETAFLAKPCADWEAFILNKCEVGNNRNMGFGVDPNSRGNYYLRTSDTSPYGLGEKGLDGPGGLVAAQDLVLVSAYKFTDAII